MKSTGIIRKLDELGRIVIPKEIRKRYKINEGDYIDISTNKDTIVLKKYDPLEETFSPLVNFVAALKEELNCNFVITDKNYVGVSTMLEIRTGDEFTESINKLMSNKEEIEIPNTSSVRITRLYDSKETLFIKSVTKADELIGYIVIFKNGIITKTDKDVSNIIKRYMLMNFME